MAPGAPIVVRTGSAVVYVQDPEVFAKVWETIGAQAPAGSRCSNSEAASLMTEVACAATRVISHHKAVHYAGLQVALAAVREAVPAGLAKRLRAIHHAANEIRHVSNAGNDNLIRELKEALGAARQREVKPTVTGGGPEGLPEKSTEPHQGRGDPLEIDTDNEDAEFKGKGFAEPGEDKDPESGKEEQGCGVLGCNGDADAAFDVATSQWWRAELYAMEGLDKKAKDEVEKWIVEMEATTGKPADKILATGFSAAGKLAQEASDNSYEQAGAPDEPCQSESNGQEQGEGWRVKVADRSARHRKKDKRYWRYNGY